MSTDPTVGESPDTGTALVRYRGMLIFAVVALAVVFQASVLWGYLELPFAHHHRADSEYYHDVGVQFRAGDWQLGSGTLVMSPGYSWLVGLLYLVFGVTYWVVPVFQGVLGVMTVWLTLRTAEQIWGLGAGLVAGSFLAFYGPLAFYSCLTLATSTTIFLSALYLFFAVLTLSRPNRPVLSLATGIALGLSVVVRPNALLLCPVTFAWFLWFARSETTRWRQFRSAGILTLGVCLCVLPVTVRNYVVTGEVTLVTASGGLNFWLGNGAGATGTFRVPEELPAALNAQAQFVEFHSFAEQATGQTLSVKQADGWWYARARQEISADPVRWLRLLGHKVLLFWHGDDLPNTHDYRFHRMVNPSLSWPIPDFYWLSPLSMMGLLWLLVAGSVRERFVASVAMTWMGAMVAYFVLGHYRMVAVPALVLCACGGAIGLAMAIRSKRRIGLAVVCLAASLPCLLLQFTTLVPRIMDGEYHKLGVAWQVTEHPGEALLSYRESLRINPRHLRSQKNMAILLQNEGMLPEASLEWERTRELAEQVGNVELAELARRHIAQITAILAQQGQTED
jgi:4-amino-4-deoxy-L-arabinose transferase-like glycosyltransferase